MTMTPEEALAMLGTEFIYEYSDGDTIPAYVKAIDLKEGKMSCFSLEDRTRDGWVAPVPDSEKVDGAWCLIASHDLRSIFRHLEIIRANGRYRAGQALGVFDTQGPNAVCAFR